MQLPKPEEVREIIERVEKGYHIGNADTMQLVALIYSLMTPDHTWWRPAPLPPGQIMLVANDTVITPLIVFRNPKEAEAFTRANQSLMYLPVPKPPCLNDEKVSQAPHRN